MYAYCIYIYLVFDLFFTAHESFMTHRYWQVFFLPFYIFVRILINTMEFLQNSHVCAVIRPCYNIVIIHCYVLYIGVIHNIFYSLVSKLISNNY